MSVDGKDLEFDGRSRIDVVDDGLKLTKRGVSKDDAGEYEVKLKNEFGEVTQKFDVKVDFFFQFFRFLTLKISGQ